MSSRQPTARARGREGVSVWRGGLALGAIALAAAVSSGSRALGVVGVGFLLASLLTWLWTWIAESPVTVTYGVHPIPANEGDRVRIALEVRRPSRFLLGSMTVTTTIGRIGQRTCRLRVQGRTARGELDLGPMPRGVFPISGTEVMLGDLLGLVSLSPAVSCEPARVVVRPRLVELDGLFSEAGRAGGDGRRLLLRRSAGFDFHSVREYEQGESLRRVHWPTSARRGRADGEGARGQGIRRGRRDPRLRPARRGRGAARLELRRRGARGRVDPAGARDPRAPGDLRVDGSRASGRPGSLGRGRSRRRGHRARGRGARCALRSRAIPRRATTRPSRGAGRWSS